MTGTSDAAGVEELHADILRAWNERDATRYAACFADDAVVIGYDGSEMHGRSEIAEQLAAIFAHHEVATYIRIVRSVRSLDERTALLHAVVGMIPPGGDAVVPERHAQQLLLGTRDGDAWRVISFQNTPARFDGRPEVLEALTDELRGAPRP
jgi:uncharacterized protein (TIGR02246 family)